MFEGWAEAFPGLEVVAADLLDGLDVANASHEDYAEAVVVAARALPTPVALCGWSMGGLAVLQAAERVGAHSVVLLEPSPPAEAQGVDESVEPRAGAFDPEEVYGPFPPGMASRPESLLARLERKRGISVPSLPCPALVVVGDEFRKERGAPVAQLYGAKLVELDGLDHWDLVRSTEVVRVVARFLGLAG